MQNIQPKYDPQPVFNIQAVQRLTALWALNEAALGGVLHVFKIPFTGLVIGSGSVILIILIAFFNRTPGVILRSTLLVMTIKAVVSPYTPINAFAAVFLQGLMGEFLFRFFRLRMAALLLGSLALFFSAMQKFLVVTLVFGMNIWNSIDLFVNYILGLLSIAGSDQLSLPISLSLISTYLFIHIAVGIMVGLKTPRLCMRLADELKNPERLTWETLEDQTVKLPQKKSKGFIRRLSGQALFAIAIAIVVLSYIFPAFDKSQGTAALIMLMRSMVIMSLWFFWVSPLAMKWLHKILLKKQSQYSQEIQHIMDIFPLLKSTVNRSWLISKNIGKWRRISHFVFNLLVIILSESITGDENISIETL